jgi:two-component system chemotaxis response regulator CheY
MAKILAVDDDLFILELYKEIFSKAGFEIHTAEDASGAMAKYQEVKPDLLVLDVDMPAGGGQKVFDRLRNLLLTATPIIFSTGTPESVAGLAKNLNVVVLKKPVNPETLIDTAKKLLKMP